MVMGRFRNFAAICASALLAACAGDADRYPSLAIRDAERVSGVFGPVAAPPAVAPIVKPPSTGDLAQFLATANESHQRFLQASERTRSLVSSAAERGIDTNVRQEALVALADLSTMRSDTATTLGDLDLMEAEAGIAFADTTQLISVRQQLVEMIAKQDATLDELWKKLGQ